MISNNAYYELFASYTVPDHNRVGYWVDLGANSKGKVIKTYNENLKKWVKVTDATSEDAVAPFIGNNGNWWIDNRDTGINASGHSPYIGDNSNWFVYSSERNEHIDTGLPSRGEAGPKGDKGDKGNDATINGVGSIKIEAGDNITITQSDDTLTIIGDVQKPDLSNYATKTEVTKLDNKLQDAVSSVFRAKGSVKTYDNLPVDKVSIGDVYNVLDTGANYVAISINPITWDKLSETVDLSKFFNKNEINSLLSTKVDKQEGKQLTTEDFTTVLKRKLEGLSNYNDTEIRNAIDSLESAFNTLVEGNATVAIDTFNEIVVFLKNVENSQDLDSIIAGINTTISKVEAKIPDTNNFLSKDGGAMNNTNLVGNLNAELLKGYSIDKFVKIHNLINGTATNATTVGLNTINQNYLWTNTPYGDIATLVDISYSPDWRSLFFISPSTKRIHTSFKYNGDTWSNWKEIAFTDGTIANSLKLNGISSGYDSLNGFIPVVGIGREMEIGSYLDFHLKGGEEKDYSTRLVCSGNTMNEVKLPLSNGTLALLSDTVANSYALEGIRILDLPGFLFGNRSYKTIPAGADLNNYQEGIYKSIDNTDYTNAPYKNFGLISISLNSGYVGQLMLPYNAHKNLAYRRLTYNGEVVWTDWKYIMFDGDTAASANKLSTTRYLWGQPFDGSGDVKGDITLELHNSLVYKSRVGGYATNFVSIQTPENQEIGGIGFLGIDNAISYYYIGHDYQNPLVAITTEGRVGINTTTPSSELHVIGKPIFRTNAFFGNAGAMHIQNDYAINGWDRAINVWYPNMNAGSNVPIHIGVADSGKNGGYIAYHYAGYNSDNNCMKIGLYAVDDILNVTANRRVGINTTTPQESLDVNGNIKLNGEISFKEGERLDQYGNLRFGEVSDNWGIFNSSGSKLFTVKNSNGHVGIGIVEPEHTLDVNGSSIFRNHVFVKKYHHIFMNTGEEGVYYTDDGLYLHNANNEYVRHLIKFDSSGNASLGRTLNMDGSDQINGKWGGIALNYICSKYVDTSIWDGQKNQIMVVFGKGRQVAIGAHSIDTPRGTLNVDGEVIFEQSRFTTTSGFVDGEYAYSHAIYGGYHGIDVCEFYENEFRFKTNGGDITSFTLNQYEAIFNGTVASLNCNFTGKWNSRERFRLIRDGEYNTWLQAATDTTNEGGKLFMSGYNGAILSEFKIYASKATCKGSIIAEGDVTAYSDIRLKNRIESVNNVLDTIDTLDVFKYTWKGREDKSVHIGVSAQQVQTIYPEFVLTSSSEDGTDYLTVNYAALATCIAIQGIKELAKKGDERDKRIAALEEEVISLKEQLRYGNK